MIFKIKNWEKFQHNDRPKPPWVKLYRNLLDDDEWFDLSDKASKTLVNLWLIGGENFGRLPTIKKLSFRLRMTEEQVQDALLELSHWLVIEDTQLIAQLEVADNTVISPRYQDAIKLITTRDRVVTPETDTETDTDTEREAAKTKPKRSPNGSRLSADWQMTDEHREFCQTTRPDLNPSEVEASFRDYWIGVAGKAGIKLNWTAAWRNWVRREKAGPKRYAQISADTARSTVEVNPDIAATQARQRADDAIPRNGASEEVRKKIAELLAPKGQQQ